jgi:hypothetical protein
MSKNRNLTASQRVPPVVRHLVSDRALKTLDVVRETSPNRRLTQGIIG